MKAALIAILGLAGLLAGCKLQNDYYLPQTMLHRDTLTELKSLYEEASREERFAIIQEASKIYIAQQDYDRAISYLSESIDRDPAFPYNTYFMLTIAWAYQQKNANPVAILYLDRILKNYPDLIVKNESIHYSSLRQLIRLVQDTSRRIEYRRDLIERFPGQINLGTELFLLAKDYESIGEWDAAMTVYRQFIINFNEDVPGYPDAMQYASNLVALSSTRKDWTYESLDELLRVVKQALATRNTSRLAQLRSKVGFFAMDWHQDQNEGNSQVLFDFSIYITGSRVFYADTLDPSSNAQEAYLRTWGWTERIAIWYLYFRKINFPADPEFHGRWEWAGIYFGEKMQ